MTIALEDEEAGEAALCLRMLVVGKSIHNVEFPNRGAGGVVPPHARGREGWLAPALVRLCLTRKARGQATLPDHEHAKLRCRSRAICRCSGSPDPFARAPDRATPLRKQSIAL